MSSIPSTQHHEYTCRKCGRSKKANFTLPWGVTKKYAAACVGMKNTRYGPQCQPTCKTAQKVDDAKQLHLHP